MGYRDTQETLRDYQTKWVNANRSRVKAAAKRYYHRNKNKEYIRHKKYVNTPRGRFSILKTCVKHYNRECDITLRQYLNLIKDDKCHYCHGKLPIGGHSLDRKNNKRDYLRKNVVPCCKKCNAIKSNILSYKEMLVIGKLLGIMWGSYVI